MTIIVVEKTTVKPKLPYFMIDTLLYDKCIIYCFYFLHQNKRK